VKRHSNQPPVTTESHGSTPRVGVPDNIERAVLFVLLAIVVLPVINACAKYLSEYSVIQVTWARYAGHFAFMLFVFAPRSGIALLRSSRLPLQLLRSTLHCASAVLTFYVLAFVSLPTATAINFTAPLMVTALAPLVLGERIGLARWLAVAAGFAGALVVVRPRGGAEDWAMMLLLVNAAASAAIQLMSRRLAQHDGAATSNTYMVLVGFVLMSIPLPLVWRLPENAVDALVFIGIGIFGGVGHYFLVRAFELAPAAFVSPFTYGQIIGATLISYLVFGQVPDAWTWVGVAIIVASGLFILYRERRSRVARRPYP
jgi:drug/metabolite transporter (DMT)-like permease